MIEPAPRNLETARGYADDPDVELTLRVQRAKRRNRWASRWEQELRLAYIDAAEHSHRRGRARAPTGSRRR